MSWWAEWPGRQELWEEMEVGGAAGTLSLKRSRRVYVEDLLLSEGQAKERTGELVVGMLSDWDTLLHGYG